MDRGARIWTTVSVVAAAAVAGGALIVWTERPTSVNSPPMVGTGPAPNGTASLNGTSYSVESTELFGENNGWLNYSFRGDSFDFHLWCEITADTGVVCGNVTEAAGTPYSFQFYDGLPSQDPPWQVVVSPDRASAVEYQAGGHARLMVEG